MASSNDSNSPPHSQFGGVSSISAPVSIPRPGAAPVGANPSLMADAYQRQGVPQNLAATAGGGGFSPTDMNTAINDATVVSTMHPIHYAQELAQNNRIVSPEFKAPGMRSTSANLAQAGVYGHPLFQQRAYQQIDQEPVDFGAKVGGIADPARQREVIKREILSAGYNDQFYENYGINSPSSYIPAGVAQQMHFDEYGAGTAYEMGQRFDSYSQVAGPGQGLFEGGVGLNRLEPTTGSLLDVTATQALRRANKEAHRKGGEIHPSIGFDDARLAVAGSAVQAGVDPSILNTQIAIGRSGADTPLTKREMDVYGATLNYAAPLLSNMTAADIQRAANSSGLSLDEDGTLLMGGTGGMGGMGGDGGMGGGGGGGGMGGNGSGSSDLINALQKNTEALNKNTQAYTPAARQLGHDAGVPTADAQGNTAQPYRPGVNTPVDTPIQPGFAPPGSGRFRGALSLAGGFVSGLFGGQATDTDTKGRRIAKGIGRAMPAIGGAISAAKIGGDVSSTLSSVAGFSRGFEGIGTFGGFAEMGASGELPALQASMMLGDKSASGAFLTHQMGGAIGAGQEFGISAEQMGGLILPMAQAAGGGMKLSDVGRFTAGFAAGEDVGGVASLMGQQRQAGFTSDRAAEFNAAKARGLSGSAATGFASNLFGAFRGVSAGSGLRMDRLKTEGRILGMGGGDIEQGSARFQRGMGVHQGAINQLFSGFQGVSDTLLMAEALGRSGGDMLEAQKLLEQDQAQGGAMARQRLMGGLGLDRRTADHVLGGQLTTQDRAMMSRRENLGGGDRFDLDQASGGNATFVSSSLAGRRNEQLSQVYSERGRSTFTEIQRQEKKVENDLVESLYKNISELGTLTDSVLTLNKTIDRLVKLAQVPVKAAAGSDVALTPAMLIYQYTLSTFGIN